MKKLLSIVLVLTLALGCMSITVAEDELPTLKLLVSWGESYPTEDNPILDRLGEIVGCKFEIIIPPSANFSDVRNAIMASGDIPDLIYMSTSQVNNYTKWATEGLLLDLEEYFNEEDMPNAYRTLTADDVYTCRIPSLDNHLYSLPRMQSKASSCILYRLDWLENLGLEVPTTAEEFKDVMIAFATQDPDGNGEDDTYGWCYCWQNDWNKAQASNMISGFDLRYNEIPNENGEYELIYAQKDFMNYIDWIKEMYDAGAIYPEYYTWSGNEYMDELWYAGKIGCKYMDTLVGDINTYGYDSATMQSTCPEGRYILGPALMKEGDSVAYEYYKPQIWNWWGVSASSKNLDLAIKLLDLGYTDEVNLLMMYGIEGLTYTSLDPVTVAYVCTDEQMALKSKYCGSSQTFNWRLESGDLISRSGKTPESRARFDEWYDKMAQQVTRIWYNVGSPLPGYSDVQTAIVNAGTFDQYNELRDKYIVGTATREELVDFINNEMIPAFQPLLDIFETYSLNK